MARVARGWGQVVVWVLGLLFPTMFPVQRALGGVSFDISGLGGITF